MIKILVNPKDTRNIFITGDSKDIGILEKHLNRIPLYQLLPRYTGIPKPEVFLNRFMGRDKKWIYYCSMGLWKEIVDFCKVKNITVDAGAITKSIRYTEFNMSKEEFREYVLSWDLNLVPRDYQLDSAWLILKYQRSLSELATRAGKTLISYIVFRTALEKLGCKKILMVVPSIHLVKQGAKDFEKYKDYFKSELIWADGEECSIANLTIGTFQSLVLRCDPRSKHFNPDYYNDYDLILVDEAHKIPCKSIQSILDQEFMKNVKIMFGFTGTLPQSNTIEWLACQASAGPKIQEITASDLIEEGFLAKPIIKQIRISYEDDEELQDAIIEYGEYLCSIYKEEEKGKRILLPPEQRKMTMIHEKILPVAFNMAREQRTKSQYVDLILQQVKERQLTLVLEQMLTMFSEPRINILKNLVGGLHKNVIIFAHNTEYINYLHKMLQEAFPDRKILKITGNTSIKKRQEQIDEMTKSDNCILVGSFGCVGTGLTFSRVNYGIFAQSFKSDIISKQSLGRLMLRQDDKQEFYLYDLIDVYPTKKIYSQGQEKVRIFKKEGHEYFIDNIKTNYKKLL